MTGSTRAVASAPAASVRPAGRVTRLLDLSAKRERGITDLLSATLGDGQLIPDALLSTDGLDLDLTPAQIRTLGREEVASILQLGISFESALCVGFSYGALTAPLHHQMTAEADYAQVQIGEETRHTRVFMELLRQIDPRARSPFDRRVIRALRARFAVWMARQPLFFQILVLGGEEIPDLMQRLVAEHPESDPHLAAVAAYHRSEEARHMSFARSSLPTLVASTSRRDRWIVRHTAPYALWTLWDTLVHPGVYRRAGLAPWKTWLAVRRLPARAQLRYRATRPVLAALVDAGFFSRRGVPRTWRVLCGVRRDGSPAC